MSVLRASSKTDPKKLANAIIANVANFEVAEIQAIGSNATYRVVKAIAIARKYFNRRNDDLFCTPSFEKANAVEEKGNFIAMTFTVGKV